MLFKRGAVADVSARAAALTAARGGTLIAALPLTEGFIAKLAPSEVSRLRQRPEISLVEGRTKLYFAGHQTQSGAAFGLDRLDQRTGGLDGKYHYLSTGTGVTIYIVDTGITVQEDDLPVHDSRVNTQLSRSFVSDTNALLDCASSGSGHGTAVASAAAGTIYGVAKSARIVSVKVGCGNPIYLDAVAQALEWIRATSQGPAVVNMSFGTCGGGDDILLCDEQGCPGEPVPQCPSPSPALDSIVRRLIDDGLLAVIAAGNRNQPACQSSPGRLRQERSDLLVISASDAADQRWLHPTLPNQIGSNYGTCVDLFAPGAGVTLMGKQGAATSFTGTSFATPYVAGAAALILSAEPSLTTQQVADRLRGQATAGVVGNPQGSPNLLLYTLAAFNVTMSQQPPWPTLSPGTNVTFTAHAAGGIGHYQYQWSSRFHWYDGYTEPWTPLGTASSVEVVIPGYTGSLEVKVVTSQDGQEHVRTRTVTVDCSSTVCAYSGPPVVVD